MIHTSDLVEKVLPEAVDQVSDGGCMIYSMRNLFYAVRQLFLTRFMICPACEGLVSLYEPPDQFRCEKCGQHQVRDALYSFRGALEDAASSAVKDHMEDLEIPTVGLEEFKEELEEKRASYWTRVADALASRLALDLEEPVKNQGREEKGELAQGSLEDPDVKEEDAQAEQMKSYLRRRSL